MRPVAPTLLAGLALATACQSRAATDVTVPGSQACFKAGGATVKPESLREMLPAALRHSIPKDVLGLDSYYVALKYQKVSSPALTVVGVTIPGATAQVQAQGGVIFSGSTSERAKTVSAYVNWIGQVFGTPPQLRTAKNAGILSYGSFWVQWGKVLPAGPNLLLVDRCLGRPSS